MCMRENTNFVDRMCEREEIMAEKKCRFDL